MNIDKEWIRSHLPIEYSAEPIEGFGADFRLDGLQVIYCERGTDSVIYTAQSEEDLRIWAFREVCMTLSGKIEMQKRKENSSKWRYSRDHAENGRWMYVERRKYIYNAIEDTRLVAFEEYLKLIKGVVSDMAWKDAVKEYTSYMNLWYRVPHWDYNEAELCFVEISESKECGDCDSNQEDPSPDSIIKIIG